MIPNLPQKFHGKLTQLTNALTNQIYRIDTKDKSYLLRVFGPLLGDRKYENTLLIHLAKNGHPVKIEHIGEGFRIESWLDHKEVMPYEMRSLRDEIAGKLGWYHSLDPPIDHSNIVFDGLNAMASDIVYDLPQDFLVYLDNQDLVLGHNDLQYGNILKTSSGLVFVDFEYSGFVPRCFDIANHFCEYMADYTDKQPEILDYERYPTSDERISFYHCYFNELRQRSADASGATETDEYFYTFDRNVALYSLLSHLYWGVWGLYKSQKESRSFDYKKYGQARIDRFNLLWSNKLGEGRIPLRLDLK